MYGREKNVIVKGYSDFKLAGNKNNCKSTLSFIFMLNGSLVSSCLKRQSLVALFLIKLKYIALTLVAKEVNWLLLLPIKSELLKSNNQYVKINVKKRNYSVNTLLKRNLVQEKKNEGK